MSVRIYNNGKLARDVKSEDFQTERGFVARVSGQGVREISPMFIRKEKADAWMAEQIMKAQREGKSVMGQVRLETADPLTLNDRQTQQDQGDALLEELPFGARVRHKRKDWRGVVVKPTSKPQSGEVVVRWDDEPSNSWYVQASDLVRDSRSVRDASAYSSYKDAHTAAVNLARQLGREVGIEKMKQFGKEVFLVHHLPNRENRYGFETRVEVVGPSDPL